MCIPFSYANVYVQTAQRQPQRPPGKLLSATHKQQASPGYTGTGGTSTDLVANNTFLANPELNTLSCPSRLSHGLTIQGNTPGCRLRANWDLCGADLSEHQHHRQHHDVERGAVHQRHWRGRWWVGTVTSVTIATTGNQYNGHGAGITLPRQAPAFAGEDRGNNLRNNLTGVNIQGFVGGGSAGGIDWRWRHRQQRRHDFRGLPRWVNNYGALGTSADPLQRPINAKKNFSACPIRTVIYDHDDTVAADIVPSNPLTGNAVYVQTLYLKFLHRIGGPQQPGGRRQLGDRAQQRPRTSCQQHRPLAGSPGRGGSMACITMLNRNADMAPVSPAG